MLKRDVGKITKLIRILGTDRQGELIAAVAALKRALAAAGADLHDLADAVESGLRPAPKQRRHRPTPWSPPAPPLDDWQAMAWYSHYHRFDLRPDDRAFVEDCLLGRFDDGVVTDWHLMELRRIVRLLEREAA